MNNKTDNFNSKNSVVSIIILLIVGILFVGIFLQGVKIKQNNDMVSISGGLFYSAKFAYSDINSIELRDSIKYGTRTNGVSLLNYKLGNFSNNEFGKYKLFVNDNINKVIVVKYGENTVVYNAKDETTTIDTYNFLLEKSGLKK